MANEHDENLFNNSSRTQYLKMVSSSLEISPFEVCRDFDQIQPLDLLLFQGDTHFSRLIQYIQKLQLKRLDVLSSKQAGLFSHCAIVLSSDMIPSQKNVVPGKKYIFESSYGGVLDIDGNQTFGVQLRDMEKVLNTVLTHEKVVCIRLKLMKDIDQILPLWKEQVIPIIDQFVVSNLHIPYPLNAAKLMNAALAFAKPFRKIVNIFTKTPKTFFCSELVAALLIHLGILPTTVNPHYVLPVDFFHDLDSINEGGLPFILDVHHIYYLCPNTSPVSLNL